MEGKVLLKTLLTEPEYEVLDKKARKKDLKSFDWQTQNFTLQPLSEIEECNLARNVVYVHQSLKRKSDDRLLRVLGYCKTKEAIAMINNALSTNESSSRPEKIDECLDSLLKEVEDTLKDFKEMKKCIENRDVEIALLRSEDRRKTSEMAQSKSMEDFSKVEHEAKRLESETESLKQKLVLEDQKLVLEDQKQELERQKQELERQKQQLEARCKIMSDEIQSHQTQLALYNKREDYLAEKMKGVGNERDSLKKERDDLQKEKETIQKERDSNAVSKEIVEKMKENISGFFQVMQDCQEREVFKQLNDNYLPAWFELLTKR